MYSFDSFLIPPPSFHLFLCFSPLFIFSSSAVLLIDRKRGKPRHLTNIDAIKKLLDAYGVPYTHLVDFRGSFEEQVAAYNDHGILLGVHGAGFINCMFMRQGELPDGFLLREYVSCVL